MPKMPKNAQNTKKTTKITKDAKNHKTRCYIVMSRAMNYDDNHYYVTEGGDPEQVFNSFGAAQKVCKRLNAERLKEVNLLEFYDFVHDMFSEENVDAFKMRYKEIFGEETRIFDDGPWSDKKGRLPENATIEQIEKLADLINLEFYYVAPVEMTR
jgi:hypothetical protein